MSFESAKRPWIIFIILVYSNAQDHLKLLGLLINPGWSGKLEQYKIHSSTPLDVGLSPFIGWKGPLWAQVAMGLDVD